MALGTVIAVAADDDVATEDELHWFGPPLGCGYGPPTRRALETRGRSGRGMPRLWCAVGNLSSALVLNEHKLHQH